MDKEMKLPRLEMQCKGKRVQGQGARGFEAEGTKAQSGKGTKRFSPLMNSGEQEDPAASAAAGEEVIRLLGIEDLLEK